MGALVPNQISSLPLSSVVSSDCSFNFIPCVKTSWSKKCTQTQDPFVFSFQQLSTFTALALWSWLVSSCPEPLLRCIQIVQQGESEVLFLHSSVIGAPLHEVLVHPCTIGVPLVASTLCVWPPTTHISGASHILKHAECVFQEINKPPQFWPLAGWQMYQMSMNRRLPSIKMHRLYKRCFPLHMFTHIARFAPSVIFAIVGSTPYPLSHISIWRGGRLNCGGEDLPKIW